MDTQGTGPDAELSRLSQHMGGLTVDERSVAYGAFRARASNPWLPPGPDGTSTQLEQILECFRLNRCPWCFNDLRAHSLDIEQDGTHVRCRADGVNRPVQEWIPGPVKTPPWRWAIAIGLWVGLPLMSIGMLSWLMPTVAAITYRRRRWVLGALVLGTLFVVTMATMSPVESEGGVTDLLPIGIWLGGTVYGGFQVKPWLDTLPPPKRKESPRGVAAPLAPRWPNTSGPGAPPAL